MPRIHLWARRALALAIGIAVSVLAFLPLDARAQDAAVGKKAPDFKLTGSDGKEYTLGQFKGKSPVVLAFFPKSFTPG